jgi:hypothetical protein
MWCLVVRDSETKYDCAGEVHQFTRIDASVFKGLIDVVLNETQYSAPTYIR